MKSRLKTSSSGELAVESKKTIVFSSEDQVYKAKTLQGLHSVDCNHSFASSGTDNMRFQSLFLDSLNTKNIVWYCSLY